jgi:hypothetical protein
VKPFVPRPPERSDTMSTVGEFFQFFHFSSFEGITEDVLLPRRRRRSAFDWRIYPFPLADFIEFVLPPNFIF